MRFSTSRALIRRDCALQRQYIEAMLRQRQGFHWRGHNQTAVIRLCGHLGLSKPQTTKMIEALMGMTPHPGTLQQQHYLGRKHRKIHALSPEDRIEFARIAASLGPDPHVQSSGRDPALNLTSVIDAANGSPVNDAVGNAPTVVSAATPELAQAPIDFRTVDLREFLKSGLQERFATVRPTDFEDLIARFFRDTGYSVEQTSYSADYGADLVATKRGAKYAVQVKRYSPANRVGVQDVNQIIGAKAYYACDHALMITTSDFTKNAVRIATKARVHLWDWDELRKRLEAAYSRQKRRWFWPF